MVVDQVAESEKETPPAEPSKETPPSPEETPAPKMYTEAELKAAGDRQVTKALATREKTLAEENETKALLASKDFDEISKRQEAKIKALTDSAARSDFIVQNDAAEFSNVLKSVPVSDLPGALESLNKSVNERALRQVSEQLKTPPPVTGEPAPEVKVADMTTDQYKAHKEKTGATY